MKKFFTLFALVLMSYMGAWADAYQSGQLKNGMLIRFRSYHVNYYMAIGDQSNNTEKTQLRGYSARPTDGRDIFQLIGSSDNGYKLYNQATRKYIGNVNGGSNITVTDDENNAGVYKFADATSTGTPTRTGFNIGTACVTLTCTGGTASGDGGKCIHQSNTDGSVTTWSATQGSYFVITSACEMPAEGEYYCLRPYYTTDTYGYLYDNGTKLQANGTSESEAAIFRAEHVNGNKVSFRFVNTNKYLRWTQGFDSSAKSNPNTGYNSDYNADYNTMTIDPADNGGNQENVQRNEYLPFLGLAAINGKGTDGNTYYFLPRKSDGGFVAGSANQLYFDNSATGRTPYFKIEKVDMTNYVTALQTKINTAYEGNGKIGYPDMSSIETYTGDALTAAGYEAATTALNNVYSNTTVNLPEAGKAYKMYFQCSTNNDSKKYYVKNTGSSLTENKDEAAIVVMGISGTANRRFYFVDGITGNYMQFRGFENDGNATYNATTNLFSIKPLIGASNSEATGRSKEERFGLVYMSAAGRPSENGVGGMVVNESTGVFDRTGDPFFNGAHTSAMVFEEASFPYTTKSLNDGGDGKYYATVALPYAMEIPAGVKAYAATENGDVLTLTDATESTQNVAKGAYILVSESATPAAVLPAAANPAAVTNELQGSITTAPAGDIYVLNKDAEGVGFFKFNGDYDSLLGKAYLPSSAKANKLAFKFEDVVSAISAIEGNSKNVEIFDLQGRRLEKAQKGMNIINGRKVLVK